MIPMRCIAPCLLLLLLGAGCGGSNTPPATPGGFAPLDANAAVLWDRQTTESGVLLQAMGDAFNANWKGLPIKIERVGTFNFPQAARDETRLLLDGQQIFRRTLSGRRFTTRAVG